MCIANTLKNSATFKPITHLLQSKHSTKEKNDEVFKDLLMETTYYTKIVLFYLDDCFKRCQESVAYKILFRTTQPAHLITMLAISTIAFFMYPGDGSVDKPSNFMNFVYLTSFATHFGAQIWMTFVSGLSLYFALPRHSFGEVQKVLFPKYFFLNSILSIITLIIFLKHHNSKLYERDTFIQVVTMALCFLIELTIRLYLTPYLLKHMTVKIAMEKKAGVGMEVGKHDPGSLANCPRYIAVHKAFRSVHMKIAMGNVLTMACTLIHLHYLSNKICLL